LILQQSTSESSIRIFGNPCDAINMDVVHARQDAYAVPQQPLFSGRHTWPDPTGRGSVAIASCGAELVDSAGAALQHVSRGEDNNRSTQRHDADMHHPQI
jgi:hypothetical protein